MIQFSDEGSIEASTILCVDDEKNILSSLTRVFRPLKYHILTAGSGREGLEILEREPVDLVISDVRMPEMNGIEFLEQVAERWPDTMRILLTGYSDLKSTVDAINMGHVYKYLSKPWEENFLKISVQRALETRRIESERRALLAEVRRQNEELTGLNRDLEQRVRERLKEIEGMRLLLEKAYHDLKDNFVKSIGVFSSIIEAREGSVAGHSRRVSDLVYRFGQFLGMAGADTQDMLFAALLHDIGKVALSDDLIRRPISAMTQDELAEMKKHPLVGESILMSLPALREAARCIRSHHELYDGSGFPDGLQGDGIPLGARIIGMVNEYDMLKNGRLLRERCDEARAVKYLLDHRGSRYDPALVDKFVEFISRAPAAEESVAMLGPEQLQPGMRLARDMLTKSGIVLLPKGHMLDRATIDRLIELSRNAGATIRIAIVQG